jgi:trans-aconitate methyltransferase
MNYRWNAEEYARNSSAQWKWAVEAIEKIQLQPGEQVLDIGCGDGKVTALLASQVPDGGVVGIDRSDEMVQYARNAFPPADNPHLTFQQMDALDIDFQERFDVVFSNATLHWVHNHRRVLTGIRTALKQGGRFFLSMGGRGNASAVVAAFEQVIEKNELDRYFVDFTFPYAFFGVEEYQAWLGEAGLRARRVELIPKDMVHASPAGLAGWLRTTWLPYLERVPAEYRENFLSQVVTRYLENHPLDRDGQTHVGMVRLEAAGER